MRLGYGGQGLMACEAMLFCEGRGCCVLVGVSWAGGISDVREKTKRLKRKHTYAHFFCGVAIEAKWRANIQIKMGIQKLRFDEHLNVSFCLMNLKMFFRIPEIGI